MRLRDGEWDGLHEEGEEGEDEEAPPDVDLVDHEGEQLCDEGRGDPAGEDGLADSLLAEQLGGDDLGGYWVWSVTLGRGFMETPKATR